MQEAEFKRLLGFPSTHLLEGRVRELADWARRWYAENGKPWVYTCGMPVDTRAGNVRLNGSQFASRQLHETLVEAGSDQVIMVLVSAGSECEEKAKQLWQEGKPDEYFFLEIYGSGRVVEHLITTTGARICAWADQNQRRRCRITVPGIRDGTWPSSVYCSTRCGSIPEMIFLKTFGSLIQECCSRKNQCSQ